MINQYSNGDETVFNNKNPVKAKYYRDENKDRIVHQYKVILVGDGGVGKTSIFAKFMSNTFSEIPSCTLKIDAKVKSIEIDSEKMVDLQVWDTCGQEKYKTITRSYYRNNHGCIIVFDVTNMHTFNNVINWYHDLKDNGQKDQTIVIVGNKKDLSKERQVFLKDIDPLITKLDITYIEISAKSIQDVSYLFEYMALKILKKEEHLNKIIDYSNNFTTSNIMRTSLTLDKSLHSAAYNDKVDKEQKICCKL